MVVDGVATVRDIYGPRSAFGQLMHAMKYRAPEETFDDYAVRYARATSGDDERLFRRALGYLREQAILPAGRQQLSVGRPYATTASNCYVMGRIPDDTRGIFDSVAEAAMTLRSGGGVGMDFSTLRPAGERVRGLGHGAFASGPVSFMGVWNEMCRTIMSAGERRGAMMGILRVDHPDILRFVRSKQDQKSLTNFNISVAVTDEFMEALEVDGLYHLRFGDTDFGTARAQDVWTTICESNFDWAEPGVVFIDRMNKLNPLAYCETVYATNPCGEQPLPPYGACLLGSINLVKFLVPKHESNGLVLAARSGKQLVRYELDFERIADAVDVAVRLFDAVIDRSNYPLSQQYTEAMNKRRMGLGVNGVANALEVCGYSYASPEYLDMQDLILETILVQAYQTSMEMAKVKGTFPLWDAEKHMAGEFVRTRLPEDLQREMRKHGLRNGLLTSIAPTGTISMAADNVTGGIEPPWALHYKRSIFTPEGQEEFDVRDYAANFFGVEGRTSDQVSAEEHVDVLCRAQHWIDSSISKTANLYGQIAGQGEGVTFTQFKELYRRAYKGGAKGCSIFNLNGKRAGLMTAVEKAAPEVEGAACFIDPTTGAKVCGD